MRAEPHRVTPRSRTGSSLLEVVAAAMLAALVVLPTMDLLIQSGLVSERLLVEGVLENEVASVLSQRQAELQDSFAAATTSGAMDIAGLENVRFETAATFHEGVLADDLIVLRATVWEDANQDGARNDGERFRELWSMIARRPNE